MKAIIAPDGAKMSLSEYDELGFEAQQGWCERHGIPLAHSGDLSRLASGVPAIYTHLKPFLAD